MHEPTAAKRISKQIICSLSASAVITFLLWNFDENFANRAPLLIFNLVGILQLPGALMLDIIVAFISPDNGWQAIHSSGQYRQLGIFINFIVYFGLFYAVLKLLSFRRQ